MAETENAFTDYALKWKNGEMSLDDAALAAYASLTDETGEDGENVSAADGIYDLLGVKELSLREATRFLNRVAHYKNKHTKGAKKRKPRPKKSARKQR